MKVSKKTLNFARIVHVYVSMALLTLLLFFSVTGIALNHPEWFSEFIPHVKVKEHTINLVDELTVNQNNLSHETQQLISKEIEKVFSISLLNIDPEFMSGELYYSIKEAGKNINIAIDIETGEVFYEQTDYGWWATLNDLHKGRNTSNFWGLIIDLSSLLFIIFAITGFILAMPQKRFRRTLILSLGSTVFTIISIIYFS